LLSVPLRRRARLSSRRPAREARTRTLACSPAAIENRAEPRATAGAAREPGRRRRAVSLVRPEQPPTVPAGQLSLSVTNPPPNDSLVETGLTPAKPGVEVEVEVGAVGVYVVAGGVAAGGGGGVEVGGGGVAGAGGGEAVVKLWSPPLVTPPALVATTR
jgi:hypothetical protein